MTPSKRARERDRKNKNENCGKSGKTREQGTQGKLEIGIMFKVFICPKQPFRTHSFGPCVLHTK